MILRDCMDMLKSLGCVKVASPGVGKSEEGFMTRLHYYYHRLLCHSLHRSVILLSIFAVSFFQSKIHAQQKSISIFEADHPYIQYTGRIDFTNPKLPRFWQPGVYITARFVGSACEVILNDEELWGKNHNYLEVV